VHGWFYGLHNGLLEDLKMTVSGPEQVREAYELALAAVHARRGPSANTAKDRAP
jgi:carbonic anhydrase